MHGPSCTCHTQHVRKEGKSIDCPGRCTFHRRLESSLDPILAGLCWNIGKPRTHGQAGKTRTGQELSPHFLRQSQWKVWLHKIVNRPVAEASIRSRQTGHVGSSINRFSMRSMVFLASSSWATSSPRFRNKESLKRCWGIAALRNSTW